MPTVDFWSKEVLGGRSGRVSIVVQLPENPELYFPQQSVVYNRADGRFYQLSGAGWAVISSLGVEDFVGLTDTPGAYAGESQKLVRVNAGETGLEFVEAAAGGATALGDLTDVTTTGAGGDDLLAYDNVASEWVVSARRVPDPAGAAGGEILQISAGSLVYVDPEFLQGADGEDGVGVPPGGDTLDVLEKASPTSYDTRWATPAAVKIEAVAGGGGFVDASGVIELDLANARVFQFLVVGNITGWSFTNAPAYGAVSPVIRVVFKEDANGGHTITGGPSLQFRDRRSLSDLNTSANAVNELHVWHDGTELVAALVENGRLDLEPISMSFEANGSRLYTARQTETLDLSDVTNLEEDGTAGTGTLTFARNGTAVSGVQVFEDGQVLKVTMASATTPSTVNIPRWLA